VLLKEGREVLASEVRLACEMYFLVESVMCMALNTYSKSLLLGLKIGI